MFSKVLNGSKIALITLMGILALNKFLLLDVQFMTNHLKTMGAKRYQELYFYIYSKDQHLKKHYLINQLTARIIDEKLIYKAEKKITGWCSRT